MSVEVFRFKKGDVLTLDQIYAIQGLGGGAWWEHLKDDPFSEMVEIVCDIRIEIKVTRGAAK